MKRATAAFLCLATLIIRCGSPTGPQVDYAPELNVFGLLVLNNGQKSIRLERTYKVTETFPLPKERAVTNARVVVRSDDQEVVFSHLFEGNYGDIEDKLVLKAGHVYQLEVTAPGFQRVVAETVIPTMPAIVSPQKGEAVPAFRTLPVKWEPALFCRSYAVTVTALSGDFEYTSYTEESEESFFAFLFAAPGRYSLKVSALDQNFYDYLRSRKNRNPIQHLEGGIGVFGSMAYHTIVFQAE